VAAWRRCVETGVSVTWPGARGYPSSLEHGQGRPGVLFWVGDISWVERRAVVALVGTRRCTPEGAQTAFEVARDLARAGVCVVSGLALGIDGAAHAGALAGFDEAGEGRGAATVGVAASGVDVVYPRQHGALWRRIASTGAIVSETPPGTPAQPWRFPARNRVIAGLAAMVVVVECHLAGGSWHTVDAALRWGVEVGAVPGSVRSPASDGTNMMLREGATPIRSARDVLDALGLDLGGSAPVAKGPGTGRVSRTASGGAGDLAHGVGRSSYGPAPGTSRACSPAAGENNACLRAGNAGRAANQASQRAANAGAAKNVSGPGTPPTAATSSLPGLAGVDIGPVEQRVLESIGWRAVCLEDAVERSGLPVGAVALALGRLEEVGKLSSEGGWWWRVGPR
jgi:DNA protecting protein DprA